LALLVAEEMRSPGAIGRNAEAMRRACRDYCDDGTEHSTKKRPNRKRRR